MGRLTSTIGTSMVNDLEFAYSDNRINITPGGTDPALLAATTAGFPPLWPLSFKTFPVGIPEIWGGLGNYGSSNNLWMIAPWNNSLDIYTVRDDFSKVIGAHTVALWRLSLDGTVRTKMNSANSNQYPTFGTADWDTSKPTGNNLANVLAPGAKWGFRSPPPTSTTISGGAIMSCTLADNWKVRRNLTSMYGRAVFDACRRRSSPTISSLTSFLRCTIRLLPWPTTVATA